MPSNINEFNETSQTMQMQLQISQCYWDEHCIHFDEILHCTNRFECESDIAVFGDMIQIVKIVTTRFKPCYTELPNSQPFDMLELLIYTSHNFMRFYTSK